MRVAGEVVGAAGVGIVSLDRSCESAKEGVVGIALAVEVVCAVICE